VRSFGHSFFGSFSGSGPKYIADQFGHAWIIPDHDVPELSNWREGDTVVLPDTFPAWPGTDGKVPAETWAQLTSYDASVEMPDGSAELVPLHVLAADKRGSPMPTQ
jgi:hypothetical protein